MRERERSSRNVDMEERGDGISKIQNIEALRRIGEQRRFLATM